MQNPELNSFLVELACLTARYTSVEFAPLDDEVRACIGQDCSLTFASNDDLQLLAALLPPPLRVVRNPPREMLCSQIRVLVMVIETLCDLTNVDMATTQISLAAEKNGEVTQISEATIAEITKVARALAKI